MVVPNLAMICENMLMSEGFGTAKILALKMTVLYKLAEAQLSKQYHYDFKLRALKSVLVMAGSLKRAAPEYDESTILMRALRDMNMPKFVYADVPVRLLTRANVLFPSSAFADLPSCHCRSASPCNCVVSSSSGSSETSSRVSTVRVSATHPSTMLSSRH